MASLRSTTKGNKRTYSQRNQLRNMQKGCFFHLDKQLLYAEHLELILLLDQHLISIMFLAVDTICHTTHTVTLKCLMCTHTCHTVYYIVLIQCTHTVYSCLFRNLAKHKQLPTVRCSLKLNKLYCTYSKHFEGSL